MRSKRNSISRPLVVRHFEDLEGVDQNVELKGVYGKNFNIGSTKIKVLKTNLYTNKFCI